MPSRRELPKIRGTQIGLRDPALVDRLKADMREGRFAYQEPRGRITGVRDVRGVYYVKEGHHRMAAAVEIYQETGDATVVQELLRCGEFPEVNYCPKDGCPLPARDWWGALRNRFWC